jgi:hypothetical protein
MFPPWRGPYGLDSDDPAGHWHIIHSGELFNLPPNLTYTLALVRYGVDVKGELDQAEVLLGRPITQRDSLVVLNPNPGGDVSFVVGSGTTPSNLDTLPTGAVGNANPWVLGQGTINWAGRADFGFILPAWDKSTMQVWYNTSVATLFSDSIPTGRNDDVAYTAPRFNYMVMFEGVGTSGRQIARWQLAQDLDLNGNPLNNAYYPYPTAALSKAEQLARRCCAGAATDLSFVFENLDELTGAVYQVWLWNEETNDLITPSGEWIAWDQEGTEVGSASGVNTFGSRLDWVHRLTTSDALAGTSVGEFTHVFLSVESSMASSPSGAQPLWSQFTDMAGAPDDPFQWSFMETGEMAFGTFGSGDPTEFSGAGQGAAAFWGQQVGASDLLIANFRNLELPPVGYFYEAWMIDDDGNQVNAGELLTTHREDPPYASLRDVDVNPDLSDFISTDGMIVWSETRTQLACPSETGGCVNGQPFYEFSEYRLMLTPKAGTGVMPSTTLLGGLVPEPVKKRKPVTEPTG